MSKYYVTDIRDFGEPSAAAELPAPARRLRDYLGAIVRAATASPEGVVYPTPLPCRRRPRRRPCPGRLLVRLDDEATEIHWRCPGCDEGGVISGWRGTIWDFTSKPSRDWYYADDPAAEVLLDEQAYRVLREQMPLGDDPHVGRIVAAAFFIGVGVVLIGFESELAALRDHVEEAALRARGERHLALERVLDALDDALFTRRLTEVSNHEAGGPGALDSDVVLRVPAGLGPGGNGSGRRSPAAEATDAYNRRPQPELGGLSPLQLQRLLSADWEESGGAVQLDRSLGLGQLEGARVLANARIVLRALAESGGTRATSAGNLNRKFVAEMVEAMVWPPGCREDLSRYNKVVNEADVWPLHLVRVLLDLAGLMKRRKGAFRITRKGEALLDDERAGELYALLFRTRFREMNLAYMTRGPEAPGLQLTVAYSFYRFAGAGDCWKQAEELVDDLLLPEVRDEIPPSEFFDLPAVLLETRVLMPLEGFGLAAQQRLPDGDPPIAPRQYRKTTLYDRFLRFNL